MAARPTERYTPAEYLVIERQAEYKNEYINGEIYPMDGANRWHCLIQGNILACLHRQFDTKPGEVLGSMMRLKAPPQNYIYAAAVALASRPELEDDYRDTLLNPAVAVEVFSERRQVYNPLVKARLYRAIPSLSDLVIVSASQCYVEHYNRLAGQEWLFSEFGNMDDSVDLVSIDCQLPLVEIYDRIQLLNKAL